MAAGSGSWGGFDHRGIYGDHFMEYLDLIDFPMESLEGGGLDQGDWDARMQALGTILVEAKPLLGSPLASVDDNGNATSNVVPSNHDNATSNVVPSNNDNANSNELPSLSVHTEVSSEVKPPINFIKEASEASIRLQNDPSHVSEVFQFPSPVSLPESTSSCSGEKSISLSSEILTPAHTTHTKHSKSSTIDHPQLGMPPISCTGKRQPRKRKFSQLSGTFSNSKTTQNSLQRPAAASKKCSVASSSSAPSRHMKYTKKCLHCGAGKTPQWRGGPMGPKTLCNACGVRYRTGRLFPEYRPAASPLFVPSLHSSSHRKVIQLRKKAARESSKVEAETSLPPRPPHMALKDTALAEIEPLL